MTLARIREGIAESERTRVCNNNIADIERLLANIECQLIKFDVKIRELDAKIGEIKRGIIYIVSHYLSFLSFFKFVIVFMILIAKTSGIANTNINLHGFFKLKPFTVFAFFPIFNSHNHFPLFCETMYIIPLTFYGIVDDKTIYPDINISAAWDKTDDPKEFAKLIKNTVKQTRVMDTAKSSFAGAIQKLGLAANILKDANDSFSELLADITGKRYDIVGPATKKIYGKPRMGNIGFDCVYDLRAGQMKFAANMIRTILDIVYPRSTPASINDIDETLLQKSSKKTVDWFKNIFGMHLTYNPFPVEVTLGQHFYMAQMVVQDVIINSSSDYFDYVPYENAPPEERLKLPAFIRVSIKLAPYMLPDPGKSWLVYSRYNLMGPDAGKPYEVGDGAI